MLLNLSTLITKYSINITGVVHIGGHFGEEYTTYKKHGIENVVFIEPCGPAFKELQRQFGNTPGVTLINVACGSITGEATMYVETANQGQSNSLLRPANHMKHYPEIKFRDTELVQVRPLDALPLPQPFNMLNIDTQGSECQVLVGGRQTLSQIDYVYIEVNQDDANLYEGACGISELDAILYEFDRVETSMTKQGWGDALYIRRAPK